MLGQDNLSYVVVLFHHSGQDTTVQVFTYLSLSVVPPQFELGGTTFPNNSVVLIDDIGEQDNALFCVTTSQDCCTIDRRGEFYYPNGTFIPTNNIGQDYYRNRGDGFIRLNRRNGATSPTGRYRCEIPDARGQLQNIFITIGMQL